MELFTIVPEPVAISVLCRYIPVEKLCGLDTKSFASLQAGEKYMVLDIGGKDILNIEILFVSMTMLLDKQ
jgi:hypothetical protein